MRTFAMDLILLTVFTLVVFVAGSALLLARSPKVDTHPVRWVKSTYTFTRWLTNPIKMCQVGALWQANFQQLALTSPTASLAGDLDYRARLYLTVANLIGGCICFYGLHLRDFELSLWVELGSYISLIGTLGCWIGLVYWTIPLPNTSYGLNLTEGFVIAVAFLRSPLIIAYKKSLHKGSPARRVKLRRILGGETELGIP